MFKIFKKKSPLEKLEAQYAALQKEAFELSKIDRTRSDQKQAEAAEVERKIAELRTSSSSK